MLSKPISVGMVDDHTLFRKMLRHFLSNQKNVIVTIQSPDMLDLFDQLQRSSVDVLLMDIFLPKLNGNDGLKVLLEKYPAIKVLVLSMSTDIDLICNLVDTGIHGYLSKSDEPEELLQALQAVANGRIYRNNLLTEALYWDKQNTNKLYAEPPISLSEREIKILQMLWDEKSNKEIADELFLGVRSVEKIRQDIKEKLGVRSTIGMMKYAIRKSIVFPHKMGSRLIK